MGPNKSNSQHDSSYMTTNTIQIEGGTAQSGLAAEEQSPCLGTIIRPQPLTIYDLPKPPLWVRPSLDGAIGPPADSTYWWEAADKARPDLVEFVETILLEGQRFIGSKNGFVVMGSKSMKPAIGKVEKLKRIVRKERLKELDWTHSLYCSRRHF